MWDYKKKSVPINVEGGIKSQSKRGLFSESWWGKRWIEALESFHDSARLARGRSYARKGQVLSVDIVSGGVKARVQGSRVHPYKVSIEMDELSEHSWYLVIEALSQKALFTARLLAGELPSEIEEIFQEVHVQLLPSHHSHLKTDCTCPDWSNPCKHVASVLYLLGEEFDRDPFLLFKMRGMDRETFLTQLEKNTLTPLKTQQVILPSEEEKSSSLSTEKFWDVEEIASDWLQAGFEAPSQFGGFFKSLGKFPFWRGAHPLTDTLDKIYLETTNNILKELNQN